MTAPVAPTPELAKQWKLEIDTSATVTPAWTAVRGIQSLGPTLEYTNQDTSTYDSGIWRGKQWTTQVAWGITGTVLRSKYDAAGVEDAGQGAIREAAVPTGVDGQTKTLHVRIYDTTGGPEAYEGFATTTWEPQSGGTTDLRTVNFTMSGDGERLEIANPSAA